MTTMILLSAIIVIICVLVNKLSHKIGIPMLLGFIVMGMLFGNDGIVKIHFDNYVLAEQVCSIALIFIMFYGGFGTNLHQAKPVSFQAGLLSTLGVVLTALFTGLFCYYALGIEIMESFLIGAVISSTDAASVFSILRSKKLGLKHNTDSMLEIESGSNDPCSYMLTIIMITVMSGQVNIGTFAIMIIQQLLFGVGVGVMVAYVAGKLLKRYRFETAGFDMAFVVGIALLSYALADVIGGNGYLSAYLCGIMLGNIKFKNKKALVHFFDGMTGLMQMLIFFLLGLLSTPSQIIPVILPSLAIMLFLTFIARPISVFAILSPLKCRIRQQLLVSFAGLRGAASIVFAIMAIVSHSNLYNDLFHIVFCIVLLSIGIQGSLLPVVSKWLDMSDQDIDVMKTFSDYTQEVDLNFIKLKIKQQHPWHNQVIKDIIFPPDTLVIMILRDNQYFIPNGTTKLIEDDVVILSAHQFDDGKAISLQEQVITHQSEWIGKSIHDYSPDSDELIIMILRGNKTIIPKGDTVILKNDILVINSSDNI